jgi:hypothetical protein
MFWFGGIVHEVFVKAGALGVDSRPAACRNRHGSSDL